MKDVIVRVLRHAPEPVRRAVVTVIIRSFFGWPTWAIRILRPISSRVFEIALSLSLLVMHLEELNRVILAELLRIIDRLDDGTFPTGEPTL